VFVRRVQPDVRQSGANGGANEIEVEENGMQSVSKRLGSMAYARTIEA